MQELCASVAQLDRAFGSDPEGRWFESSRAHQRKRPVCGLAFFFGARCGGVIRSLRSLYAKRGASGPPFSHFFPRLGKSGCHEQELKYI